MARDPFGWLRLFPELRYLPTRQERKAAWSVAFRPLWARYFIFVLLASFAAAAAFDGAGRLTRKLLPSRSTTWHFARGAMQGVVGAAAGLVAVRLMQRRIQRSLREQLVARGVPICIACGYDLRGQTTPRCPECGTPFDPALIQSTTGLERTATFRTPSASEGPD